MVTLIKRDQTFGHVWRRENMAKETGPALKLSPPEIRSFTPLAQPGRAGRRLPSPPCRAWGGTSGGRTAAVRRRRARAGGDPWHIKDGGAPEAKKVHKSGGGAQGSVGVSAMVLRVPRGEGERLGLGVRRDATPMRCRAGSTPGQGSRGCWLACLSGARAGLRKQPLGNRQRRPPGTCWVRC